MGARCTTPLRAELGSDGEHLPQRTHAEVVLLKHLFAQERARLRSKVGAAAFDALLADAAAANERAERERPQAFDGRSDVVPLSDLAICTACLRLELVEIESSWSLWRACKSSGLASTDVVYVMGMLLRNLVPAGVPIVEVHELPGDAIRELDRIGRAKLGKNLEWQRVRSVLRRAGVGTTAR